MWDLGHLSDIKSQDVHAQILLVAILILWAAGLSRDASKG
jgi:hypothetical protein